MATHNYNIRRLVTAAESRACGRWRARADRGFRDDVGWEHGDRFLDSHKSSSSDLRAQTRNHGRISAGLSLDVSWSGNRNVLHERLPCSKYQVNRLFQFTAGIAQRRIRQRQRFSSTNSSPPYRATRWPNIHGLHPESLPQQPSQENPKLPRGTSRLPTCTQTCKPT